MEKFKCTHDNIVEPIVVISENFDALSSDDKCKILTELTEFIFNEMRKLCHKN